MSWYLEATLIELFSKPERTLWAEEGAYDQYYQIQHTLPKELKNPQRLGALVVAEVRGIEGKHFWMLPIEGHKKLLGPKNEVKLIEGTGVVFFEGIWNDVNPEWISTRAEFFVWVKPREEASKDSLPLHLKIKGFIRYLLHKKRN